MPPPVSSISCKRCSQGSYIVVVKGPVDGVVVGRVNRIVVVGVVVGRVVVLDVEVVGLR